MQNIRKITKDLYYLGCQDRRIALFENVYPVADGASYNSYLLKDEKTVLFDTVDKAFALQFFSNLEAALDGQNLDYLVINHLEPDHSALIKDVIEKYRNIKIVCNQKIHCMLFQFFEFDFDIQSNFQIVNEGDIIDIGNHKLTFVMAPMVHWPEVMVTYDTTSKILFSADAFGSFGALGGNLFDDEVEFEPKIDEYRRYYTNIVGKYGPQVKMLLSKASGLDIDLICPLHGLLLRSNISKMVELYSKWADYTPEMKSALVVYGSVYGNTQNAAEILASKIADSGIKNIKLYDVSKTHPSYILSDAFKYSHIVLASITYNNNIFVNMDNFIRSLVKSNLQKRTYAIIENGSWACNCADSIIKDISTLKDSKILNEKLTLKSALKENQLDELELMAQTIVNDIKNNEL